MGAATRELGRRAQPEAQAGPGLDVMPLVGDGEVGARRVEDRARLVDGPYGVVVAGGGEDVRIVRSRKDGENRPLDGTDVDDRGGRRRHPFAFRTGRTVATAGVFLGGRRHRRVSLNRTRRGDRAESPEQAEVARHLDGLHRDVRMRASRPGRARYQQSRGQERENRSDPGAWDSGDAERCHGGGPCCTNERVQPNAIDR